MQVLADLEVPVSHAAAGRGLVRLVGDDADLDHVDVLTSRGIQTLTYLARLRND